ncbi:hypothetical protein MMC12_008514, partial [Toensbergia leucococca]|nr:hypothetical protein [Toensbergia leucococca]
MKSLNDALYALTPPSPPQHQSLWIPSDWDAISPIHAKSSSSNDRGPVKIEDEQPEFLVGNSSSPSVKNEDGLMQSTLISDLWNAAVEGLDFLGQNIIQSIRLGRTFQNAAVRLKIWGDDFEFSMCEIDMVLSSNSRLHHYIVTTLGALVTLL